MKKYGVKAVSKMSGVSVRTLHYYDQIGLLKPAHRSDVGYRFYGKNELLRLQQILFYKELDFPLKEIVALLDQPEFDLIDALESHKTALKARQKRISNLLATLDNTINQIKQGNVMSKPEMLYEGLPKEMGTTYRQEAMAEYGTDAVEHAEKELLKLGKGGFEQLKQDFDQVVNELFALRNEPPEHENVQHAIARHYKIIRQFWGTANTEDPQAEAYAGLGHLYVNDERFTMINGKPQPEFAAFMQKAMRHFADTQLKSAQ